MIKKYVSKRKYVDALQWTGKNWKAIKRFTTKCPCVHRTVPAFGETYLYVNIPTGAKIIDIGDWIIRYKNGGVIHYTPDEFRNSFTKTRRVGA